MKSLRDFLTKEGLLNRYIKNWKDDLSNVDYSLSESLDSTNGGAIIKGFIWIASVEGCGFWDAVNSKYSKYLNNTTNPKTKIAVVEGGKAPIISTSGSGGIDMFVRTKEIFECDLYKYKYNLGCKFEIPKGYIGIVNMRSGSAKIKVRLANGVGFIDSDYRGEVIAIVSGTDADSFNVGDKMCQMIVVPCLTDFEIVDESELSVTERGENGYGSTGK